MIPFLLAGATVAAVAGTALFNRSVARKAEAAIPPDGEFILIDGNRLHYVDCGPRGAPAILLIHGLGGTTRNFARPLVDDLAADHRVVLVDRPGSGWSERAPGASSSLWQQAAVIARFIQALGLERPTVVGHSLGGALALTLAAEHRGVVGRVGLICPLTQDEEDVPEPFRALEIRSPLVRRLVAHTVAIPLALANRERFLRAVFAPEPVPEDFPIEGGAALGVRPQAFYETSSDLVALEDQLPRLVDLYPKVEVPVRILCGAGDPLLDPDRHGNVTASQLPDCRCDIVPGGHMLPFTQPETVAAWIRKAAGEEMGDEARAAE